MDVVLVLSLKARVRYVLVLSSKARVAGPSNGAVCPLNESNSTTPTAFFVQLSNAGSPKLPFAFASFARPAGQQDLVESERKGENVENGSAV